MNIRQQWERIQASDSKWSVYAYADQGRESRSGNVAMYELYNRLKELKEQDRYERQSDRWVGTYDKRIDFATFEADCLEECQRQGFRSFAGGDVQSIAARD